MTSDYTANTAGKNQTSSTLAKLEDQAGEKAGHLADSVKDEVSRREKGVRSGLSKQADDIASALRSARSEVDPDSSVADVFDYAADSVSGIAQSLKSGNTADMVNDVRSFARERPGTFLGVSALAGFAAARFLLASAPGTGGGTGGAYNDGPMTGGRGGRTATGGIGATGSVPGGSTGRPDTGMSGTTPGAGAAGVTSGGSGIVGSDNPSGRKEGGPHV